MKKCGNIQDIRNLPSTIEILFGISGNVLSELPSSCSKPGFANRLVVWSRFKLARLENVEKRFF
jgi:hypothetical protein